MAGFQAKDVGDALAAYLAAVAIELTLEVTANLIEATPVDTGHARANWVPGIGDPPEDEQPAGAQAAGMAAVATYKLGDGPLNITNNVPYIGPLLNGHSSQAAPGWDLAAVDAAVATVQARHDGLNIDLTTTGPSVRITPREPPP